MESKTVQTPFFYRCIRTPAVGPSVLSKTFGWVKGSDTFSGVNNPSWRDQISNHTSATTPMDAVWYSQRYRAYAGTWVNVAKVPDNYLARATILGTHNGSGSNPRYAAPPGFSGSSYTTAHNEAVRKLYDQIRRAESMSNIGEDLGEISQTYRMVRRPMAGILDITNHALDVHIGLLKSARWNNVKAVAKGLANVALEYRFGITPLVHTLAEATVALENRDSVFHYISFSAVGKGSGVYPGYPTTNTSDIEYCRQTFTRILLDQYKVRYKGEYTLTSTLDKVAYNQSLGLTWREAIPTLYNLIPYSFLLDYVLNLNQFIEALAVPWGKVAWCNLTEKVSLLDQAFTSSGPDINIPGLHIVPTEYQSMFMELASHRTRRRAQLLIPLPWLQVKIPNRRQDFNAIALLASRLPLLRRLNEGLRKSGFSNSLNNEFYKVNLLRRASMNKVPYPFHQP